MPMFAIRCTDNPGALQTRLDNRPAHLAYIERFAGVRLAGALLDDDGNPAGSLIIFEAADQAEAEAFAAGDPFAVNGVFARVEIAPWRIAIGTL